jgi:hypothetical protein
MKQAAFVLPLTVLLALPARAQETTSAETKRQNVTTLAVRARKAESQGDRVEALKAYEALRTETAQTQDTELVHEHLAATLRAAQTLDALAAASGNASDRATARSHYEAVAAQGDAVQARAARNGLGVLLLREGRPADALAAMREIDIAAVPAPQQFVFHSNLAHGYEATGELNEALASYKAALAQEPGFGPAQEGAFRVLHLRRPPPVQEAQALVQMLADQGQARAAGERLRDLLIAWAGQAAGSELLPLLARTYVTAKVSPQDFAEGTRPLLAKVTDPALSTALAQLATAYLDEIPLGMDGAEARRRFSAWADGNAKARALAGVLRLVGSLEDAAEHPRQALARAWVAWLIDRRDPENAVAVV